MIGKILKTMRKIKGLTQTELSKLIDVPQNTISQYETGRIEPTFEMILKISKCCGFKVEFKNGECILTPDNIDRKEI